MPNDMYYIKIDIIKAIPENRTAIMGIAMVSIMLFHQCFTSVIPFNAFHNFGYWGVDIFLFLSGMGLAHSLENNSVAVFYKRRFKRIIPSCIICGVVKYIAFLILGTSIIMLKDSLHLGWWSMASLDLWFIPAIIILYAISPLLYNILCKWPYIAITIIIIIFFINGFTLKPFIGYNWISPQGVLSWTIERLPVFSAGMFIAINNKCIDNKINFSFISLLIAVGIRLLIKFDFSFRGDESFCMFALAIGIPSLIAICIYFLKILPSFFKQLIEFLGKYSLELYLVHEFIFWVLKIRLNQANPWLLLITGFFLSCIIAYLCKSVTNLLTLHDKAPQPQ